MNVCGVKMSTCKAHVHDDDEEVFAECFASYIENGLHNLVVSAKRDEDENSILPEPTDADHLLVQEEGASEESPSSKVGWVRPSSDKEEWQSVDQKVDRTTVENIGVVEVYLSEAQKKYVEPKCNF